MTTEKIKKTMSGYGMLLLVLVMASGAIYLGVQQMIAASVILGVIAFFVLPGFSVINPNEAIVATLFGVYVGTIKENGFLWMNPFYTKKKVFLYYQLSE